MTNPTGQDELRERRKVVKDDDAADSRDWFEAVPVSAIEALLKEGE